MRAPGIRKRVLSLLAGALALAAWPARATELIYSNDVLGELEPCGCRNNPLGGMTRKARMLELRPDFKKAGAFLQLDAGNLLFESASLPEQLAKQSEVQASHLVDALNLLGHDAVTPGEKDFALGLRTFERLRKRARFKFLAANLRRKGAPFLPASAVFTRPRAGGQLRIGVIGVVGDDLGWPRELKATAPIPAARAEARKLRPKVDVLIALTHLGFEKDQELAKAVPELDLVVGGHSQTFLQDPPKQGKTVLYQSSFRNQYVGVVTLAKPFSGDGHQLVALDAAFDPPAGADAGSLSAKMEALVKKFKDTVAEINSKEEAKLVQASIPSAAGGGPKFHTFPRCAECHLKQFDFWRKTPHANALEPLLKASQARNKACLGCHTVGLGDPEGFANVAAIAEVRPAPSPSRKATDAPEAEAPPPDPQAEVSPQPVGPEEFGELLREMRKAESLEDKISLKLAAADPVPLRIAISRITRAWTPVQCENCHSPGREHPFGSGGYSRTVAREACLKCHRQDRAPEWFLKSGEPDWEKIAAKRASVTCPPGEYVEPSE